MELSADIQREIQQQFKNSYAQLLADITRIYEQGAMRDALTGLYNKQAFERDSTTNHIGFVGILFADGHSAGDKLIKDFAAKLKKTFISPIYNCYHISGDEFIVAGFDIKIHEFLGSVLSFHKSLWVKDNPPLAALGYSAGVFSDIAEITEYAEKAMYEDKQKFYNSFPQMRR